MRKGGRDVVVVGGGSCGDGGGGGGGGADGIAEGWWSESERENRGEEARLTPEKEIHRESTLRESELSLSLSAGHKGSEYCLL